MKTETTTHKVILKQCSHNYAWYSRITDPIPITVTESGDPDEWYITEGMYEGSHVDKADCVEMP